MSLDLVIKTIVEAVRLGVTQTSKWHSDDEYGGDFWDIGHEATLQIFSAQALSDQFRVQLEYPTDKFELHSQEFRRGRIDVLASSSEHRFAIEFKKYDGLANLVSDAERLAQIVRNNEGVIGLIVAPALYNPEHPHARKYIDNWKAEILERLKDFVGSGVSLREASSPDGFAIKPVPKTQRSNLVVRVVVVEKRANEPQVG